VVSLDGKPRLDCVVAKTWNSIADLPDHELSQALTTTLVG